MDNNIYTDTDQNAAVIAYRNGWRAVIRDDQKWYMNISDRDGGIPKVELSDWPWVALRAYQDEQRKKGVPIVHTYEEYVKFMELSYAEFGFGSQSGTEMPCIWILGVGQFTNFRWREGYPKKEIIHIERMGDGFVNMNESPLTLRTPKKPNLCGAPDCSPVGCGNMVCKTLGASN